MKITIPVFIVSILMACQAQAYASTSVSNSAIHHSDSPVAGLDNPSVFIHRYVEVDKKQQTQQPVSVNDPHMAPGIDQDNLQSGQADTNTPELVKNDKKPYKAVSVAEPSNIFLMIIGAVGLVIARRKIVTN